MLVIIITFPLLVKVMLGKLLQILKKRRLQFLLMGEGFIV